MKPETRDKLAFDSKAVYYNPDPSTKSINAPLYLSNNFQYDEEIYQNIVEGARITENIYGRCGNPNETLLQEQVAMLENADGCLALGSGMAAVATTCLALLRPGDHIVSDWTTYSSTHEMFDHRLTDFGIETTFVDCNDIEAVKAAITEKTKIIYFETIANPNMRVTAIPPLVKLARDNNLLVICDNTFASPYVMRPLDWGVDIVVESATKFMGGHNDVLGGIIAIKKTNLPDNFLHDLRWGTHVKLGGVLSPFNAWMLLRGLQTLPVRLERQCKTAMKLALYLENHPAVQKVHYPGLVSHPNHEIAKTQMPNYGAMLTFEVADGQSAIEVCDSLELCAFAASLGSVRTITQIPATMAFLDIPKIEREKMNIQDGMVRVSVGLEDPHDVINDIDQALNQITIHKQG
jgi:methionine-gamma-lyase